MNNTIMILSFASPYVLASEKNIYDIHHASCCFWIFLLMNLPNSKYGQDHEVEYISLNLLYTKCNAITSFSFSFLSSQSFFPINFPRYAKFNLNYKGTKSTAGIF